jgi:hypothetical protein
MAKTLDRKVKNNKSYRLEEFRDNYVIYRNSQAQGEADFSEELKCFSEIEKAKDFFKKI